MLGSSIAVDVGSHRRNADDLIRFRCENHVDFGVALIARQIQIRLLLLDDHRALIQNEQRISVFVRTVLPRTLHEARIDALTRTGRTPTAGIHVAALNVVVVRIAE